MATNLVVALAMDAPNQTVLIALDLQFGDVGTLLNLDPEGTIPDVFEAPASADSLLLKTFLVPRPTGMYVLCSPAVVGTSARLDAFTVAAAEE